MVSALIAIAAFAGVALVFKLATAAPNPAFDPAPYPDPDPDQQKLVALLIADATGTDTQGLVNFIRRQRWGGTELRNRLNYARNRIRLTAEPAVFQRVQQRVRRIILNSYTWGVAYYNDA
jgi:hypothetical protein